MPEAATVCVIESNPQYRQKIAAILEFIDFTSLLFLDASQWSQQLAN